MNVLSRRQTLGLMAAVTIPPTAVVAAAPIITPTITNENADLLAAYERLLQVRGELAVAEDAIQWLVDEWRHLWPLAPEELLGGANADCYGRDDEAERDIAGRYLKRDTSDLTKRLPKKWREENTAVCFTVLTPEKAHETIEFWSHQVPKGRTQKALEQRRARRDAFIKGYQQKLPLAQAYQKETARLREASGVEEVKQRISVAKAALTTVSGEISTIPAFTHNGLRIKAEAIEANPFFEGMKDIGGLFGEMARFIESAVAVGGAANNDDGWIGQ
jgi:hypothetical protein